MGEGLVTTVNKAKVEKGSRTVSFKMEKAFEDDEKSYSVIKEEEGEGSDESPQTKRKDGADSSRHLIATAKPVSAEELKEQHKQLLQTSTVSVTINCIKCGVLT